MDNKKEILINRLKIIIVIIFIIAYIILKLLYESGYIAMKGYGISAIASNMEIFTNEDSYLINENHTIYVNLSDLDSNIGKTLYNDGLNSIKIESVVIDDVEEPGNYIIKFRAYGSYDLQKASLVSATKFINLKYSKLDVKEISEIFIMYKGEKQSCRIRGLSGLNYKDGAWFAVTVFPSIEYVNEVIQDKEYCIVEMTFTSLYYNKWRRR
jgi:hypothetical protein